MKLRVSDDDTGTVTVSLDDAPLREFWYSPGNSEDRKATMLRAQYYREGYSDALLGHEAEATP